MIFANDSEIDFINLKGKTIVAKNSTTYLRFNGYEGGLQIFINGTGVASYLVSVTLFSEEDVSRGKAKWMPLSPIDEVTDLDFSLYAGVNIVKIENRSTSVDSLTAVWG